MINAIGASILFICLILYIILRFFLKIPQYGKPIGLNKSIPKYIRYMLILSLFISILLVILGKIQYYSILIILLINMVIEDILLLSNLNIRKQKYYVFVFITVKVTIIVMIIYNYIII